MPNNQPESPIITKSRQYIQDHFHEPISVPDIAQHVALNPSYFSKLFRRHTGTPPHQYLSHIRINYAKILLAETTHNLSYIADKCGYASTSHFIRAFKQVTAITPTHFRRYFDPAGFRN